MSRIVHCQKADYDAYIGRGSCYGNPFKIGPHGNRTAVINAFRRWVETGDDGGNPEATPARREALLAALPDLKGAVMGCYCAPLACHASVLLKLLKDKGIE